MDCVISCHFSLLIGNYFDLTLNLCVALYLRQPNHSFLFAEWVFFFPSANFSQRVIKQWQSHWFRQKVQADLSVIINYKIERVVWK